MRIAMWSGPRNLSTAMMYAFAGRSDCAVSDEPFYAAYLTATGFDHPMRAEILASQSGDPFEVAGRCAGPVPGSKAHWYQKHMVHHMQPGFPLDWMEAVTNVFLIRHPARVVASYAAKRESPTAEDLGFAHLDAVYDHAVALGQSSVVIDGTVIRANPRGALQALCAAIGIAFDPGMLSWPAGGHPDDGVWAAHWYGAIHQSTGFEGAEGSLPNLSGDLARLAEDAMPSYERLRARALMP